ncbi:MAG: spondin domain-containing protein [Candidatus Limnocylindria bacterium]
MHHRIARLLAVGALSVAMMTLLSGIAAASSGTTYRITITNETSGQPFTPPVLITHDPTVSVFEIGAAASEGVIEIAENGNVMPLVDAMTGADGVHDVVTGPGPVKPGESQTLEITADDGEVLSWVSMLICTNDGFTGLHGQALAAGTITTDAYETTTEMNTEVLGDIVPPCQAIVGVTSPTSAPGTGMSNPALAEDGVIAAHPGIAGTADLQVDPHGWTDPVANVTIEVIPPLPETATAMPETALTQGSSILTLLLVVFGLSLLSAIAAMKFAHVRRPD